MRSLIAHESDQPLAKSPYTFRGNPRPKSHWHTEQTFS